MKDSRVSTKLFNEWICLTSEYEKTLARIGKDAYQAYIKGEVRDEPTLEICRRITALFKEARQRRQEMEEDFRRTALAAQGASDSDEEGSEEKPKALVPAKQTIGQKVSFGIKQLIFRFFMNRDLDAFKGQVQEYSRELGRRAMVCYQVQPVLKTQTHLHLCKLANQLEQDSNEKWDQILEAHHRQRRKGGQSFHLAFVQFAVSFASYAKNTRLKPFFERILSYDYASEANKLKKLYADSHHAEALAVVQKTPDLDEIEVDEGVDQLDILERAFAAQPSAIEKLDGTKLDAAPKPAYVPGRSGEWKKAEGPAPKGASWPPGPPNKEPASAENLENLPKPEGGRPPLASRPQTPPAASPQAPPPPPPAPAPPPPAAAPAPPPVAPAAPPPPAASAMPPAPPPVAPPGAAPPPPPTAPPAASGMPPVPPAAAPAPPPPPAAASGAPSPPPRPPAPPPGGATLRPPPPLETGPSARPPLGERRLSLPRRGELAPPPPANPLKAEVKVPELDLDLPPKSPPATPPDRPAPLPPPPRLSSESLPPLSQRRVGGPDPQIELPPPPLRKEDKPQQGQSD